MIARFLLSLPVFFSVSTGFLCAAPEDAKPDGQKLEFFESKVRPILVKHCYKCHSEQADKVKGGLLLDTKAGWEMGGDSGDAIIPGDVDGSLLIEAVRYEDSDMQMPPKYKLGANDVRILENWIRMGAPDPRAGDKEAVAKSSIDIEEGRKFWCFQPIPKDAKAPEVANPDWAKDELDHFVLSGLEKNGLKPASPADRATLLRRVTFDLIGLPPSLKEIADFKNDSADDDSAFAKVVDRLLASPQFGERWGRHWLDIVRYAESVGRTRNYPFPFAWRYRDYVIKAFNQDKPYNRFVTEQLAGDLLPAGNRDERNELHVATGFLALGSQDLNERDAKQYLMDVVDEQIDVTGRALMALTTGCARCHDHKFDPIPTSDYYALAGIFKSSEMLNGYSNKQGGNKASSNPDRLVKLDVGKAKRPVADTEPPAESEAKNFSKREEALKKRLKLAQKKVASLGEQMRRASGEARSRPRNKKGKQDKFKQSAAGLKKPEGDRAVAAQNRKEIQKEIGETRAEIKTITGQLAKLRKKAGAKGKGAVPKYDGPLAMGVREAGRIEDCRINIRGEAANLGAEVPRGFLQVIARSDGEGGLPQNNSGRLELAQWITSAENPLTPRVMVNRIWHHLFGRGIVRTVDNFGETGERPTHPELLDHLASRFISSNEWSVKKMIREIVLSSTYRMSSTHDESNYAKDPGNEHFWRMNVRRLEVEAIRDAMLASGGRLDLEPAKGSPVAKMKGGATIGSGKNPGMAAYKTTKRSVYLPIVRNNIPEVMENFDFAEPSSVIGRRDVTTVSTQALFMMNGQFVIEQARALATRLMKNERLPTDQARVRAAYLVTLGRAPGADELKTALDFLGMKDGDGASSQWTLFCQALFAGAEFRYLQ